MKLAITACRIVSYSNIEEEEEEEESNVVDFMHDQFDFTVFQKEVYPEDVEDEEGEEEEEEEEESFNEEATIHSLGQGAGIVVSVEALLLTWGGIYR